MPVMITYCLSFVNICFIDNYFLTQKSIIKILKLINKLKLQKETAELSLSNLPSLDDDDIAADSIQLMNCASYDEWIKTLMHDEYSSNEVVSIVNRGSLRFRPK